MNWEQNWKDIEDPYGIAARQGCFLLRSEAGDVTSEVDLTYLLIDPKRESSGGFVGTARGYIDLGNGDVRGISTEHFRYGEPVAIQENQIGSWKLKIGGSKYTIIPYSNTDMKTISLEGTRLQAFRKGALTLHELLEVRPRLEVPTSGETVIGKPTPENVEGFAQGVHNKIKRLIGFGKDSRK